MNKKIFLVFSSLLLAVYLPAQVRKIEFQASGLTCSMCSKAVSKAVSPLPFVKDIKTDLNKNLFVITTNDSVFVNPDDIRKKVEEAGFSVAKLYMEMDFSAEPVKSEQHLEKNGYHFNFVNVQPKTLNGNVRLQVIDKGFVSAKDYKKFAGLTKMKCYKTGYAEDCCEAPLVAGKTRIYHVTL